MQLRDMAKVPGLQEVEASGINLSTELSLFDGAVRSSRGGRSLQHLSYSDDLRAASSIEERLTDRYASLRTTPQRIIPSGCGSNKAQP